MRLSTEAVSRAWDDPLPEYLRDIWVQKFWEMIELSKVEFPRCAFPLGVTYKRLLIVSLSDIGLIGKLQCFYSLKEISEDNYHVQLIYSKSQLSDKRSVPNQELDSLNSSSNVLDKICHCLGNVDGRAMLMDSTVCAYWLMKNPIKLGVFQRLRVQNIIKLCDPANIYHIRSSWNSSDVGTKKPEPISSVLPGSFFSNGPEVLKYGIDGCVQRSYIKAIADVILNPTVESAALDGFTHKNMPQRYFDTNILSDTHNNSSVATFVASAPHTGSPPDAAASKSSQNREILSDTRHVSLPNNHIFINKVKDRFAFHEYLVNPIERPWSVSVRTMSIVLHFIRQILLWRLQSKGSKGCWIAVYKHIFCTEYEPILQECFTNLCFSVDESFGVKNQETHDLTSESSIILLSDVRNCIDPKFQHRSITQPLRYADMFNDIQSMKLARESAIVYFLRLASSELQNFYSKQMLRKHAFLMNGIYYSKQRLLEVSNITNLMNDEVSSHELGIHNRLPCSDRYSPVAISIMMHFHRKVTHHQGVDCTWSSTLSSIYIFQGQPMLTEIIRSCFHCRHKLKKKFKTSYGPINKISLTFAAVNRHVMLDLSGPYMVKTRLHARATRANSNLTKVYLLHTVCLTSFINSIVIVEDYGSQAFTDALHRIGTRYGYPSLAYTDASKSQLQSLLGTELTLRNLLGSVYKETGIEIKVSGSGSESHSRQGRIEKAIHCFQLFITNTKSDIRSLTILQFDSLISQACAFLNSMSLCHKKG